MQQVPAASHHLEGGFRGGTGASPWTQKLAIGCGGRLLLGCRMGQGSVGAPRSAASTLFLP